MKKTYPEIEALNRIIILNKASVTCSSIDFLIDDNSYPRVQFSLGNRSFHFFVEDEYDDFRFNYPLLNLCVALRELECFLESDNYQLWCKEHGFDSENSQVRQHFDNLELICSEVENLIGKIDSKISNWDFEMSSGAAKVLRKLE